MQQVETSFPLFNSSLESLFSFACYMSFAVVPSLGIPSSMVTIAFPRYLFLLFLVLLPLPAVSHNVSLGDSLSLDGNSPWISPSGDFAFGFRRVGDNKVPLLAIWFNKIQEQTIVWYAKNGAGAVLGGTKAELTREGQFVLTNQEDREIWRAENINGTVASAAMLDHGAFVLKDANYMNVWESFRDPTDTILPSQELSSPSALTSRQAANDFSRGRFQLRLTDNGTLGLSTIAQLSDRVYTSYWVSEPDVSVLAFNQMGNLYLKSKNGSMSTLSASNDASVPTSDFYHRATLDFDGVFRHYTHPKAHRFNGNGNQSWNSRFWVPSDICAAIEAELGSGACGFNSYCTLNEDLRPSCECPPGYTYLDEGNKWKGCKQNFISQSCETNGSREEPQFEMSELYNIDWPRSDFELYEDVSEDNCSQACLEDCFCAVAIHGGGDCWKKKLPLSNGRRNGGRKAFIKVAKSNSRPPDTMIITKKKKTFVTIISVLLGSSAFLNFLLLSLSLLGIFYYKKNAFQLHQGKNVIEVNLRSFTYKELEKITDGFKEELGRGSCGIVYKGNFASDHVTSVAVKKLDKVVKESEKEFKTEVSAISQIHHRNLVRLLGFCDEEPHRLLVYEYMSNGSLASFLFGSSRPSWHQRTQIAFGIARGLTYLHEECGNSIIHCDIKPQNILLDDSLTARISDFGLAKLLNINQTRTTTGIRGTKGYVAPEWFKNMSITAKVDVYSFGVVLMEIVCCRRNVDLRFGDEDGVILTDWVCDCYREGRLDRLVENDEEALMYDGKKLEKMLMAAIWCIQEDPSLRPSMKKVTQILEGAVEVPAPPDPFSFLSALV